MHEPAADEDITLLACKSWTAYGLVAASSFAVVECLVPFIWQLSAAWGASAALLFTACSCYAALDVYGFRMYCDDVGVWLYWRMRAGSGARYCLPWDLIESAATEGSSTIEIRLRGNRTPVRLSHISGARFAAAQINELRAELARERLLV